MGKKMKLPFLSKTNPDHHYSSRSSWPWPSSYYCHQQPRTLSFRASEKNTTAAAMFNILNSAYKLENNNEAASGGRGSDKTESSVFTNSSGSASFSTASDDESGGGGECVETVIRGLRSERLFFEPGQTSSILEEATKGGAAPGGGLGGGDCNGALFPFKESVALTMDSRDPFEDFKKSMEEMVEAHGLKDWEGLEELLCCYLRVNGKSNHGYIVGAFVDLLVGLAFRASPSSSSSSSSRTTTTTTESCSCSHHYSPTSPLSFYTSCSSSSSTSEDSSSTPCVSSLEAYPEGEEEGEEIDDASPCSASFGDDKETKKDGK